jgi:hypothetical protein
MNLEEALFKLETKAVCVTKKWLDNLGADNHALLYKKYHEGYPVNRLWRASQLLGNEGSAASFARHFRKECACK